MSWSVSGSGKAPAVAQQIAGQIAAVKMADPAEQETVELVGGLIAQTLGTFDPDKLVKVAASGSMGYKDWGAKTGPFQQFAITVEPIHLTAT